VAKIDTSQTYDKGRPKMGGLSDPRLGTMDRAVKCTTDGSGVLDCPGYFGHIELAKPMYHVHFIRTVVKVLRCVSYHNSRLLVLPDDPKFKAARRIKNPERRLRAFTQVCQGKRVCEHTGAPQPAVRLEHGTLRIVAEFAKTRAGEDGEEGTLDAMERKQEVTAERALEILRRISDEDCEALGFDPRFSRPDWMILSALPVPPPPVRPSVQMDSSARSEDDLTHQLSEILKANNRLRNQEEAGAPQHIISEFALLLQVHLTGYLDNSLPGLPQAKQKSGRPIKSIAQRLKGKEGRVRGNLMGKRVDYSARTVITGDPNLALDELGVPWGIALNLTFPEVVTPHNVDWCERRLQPGRGEAAAGTRGWAALHAPPLRIRSLAHWVLARPPPPPPPASPPPQAAQAGGERAAPAARRDGRAVHHPRRRHPHRPALHAVRPRHPPAAGLHRGAPHGQRRRGHLQPPALAAQDVHDGALGSEQRLLPHGSTRRAPANCTPALP
jgi:DNA-directed RNA polymerase II subunit RPB1